MRAQNKREREYADKHGVVDDELRSMVHSEQTGVIAEVLQNELTPIVREAIDDEILQAIGKLVALTPKAVDALALELEATTTRNGEEVPDIGRRAVAARTVMKYTVGHPALAPQPTGRSGLEVNFMLPRPNPEDTQQPEAPAPVEGEEVRECDICHQLKLDSQFVAGSNRCAECHHENRKKVLAQFHLDNPDA